ncbi:ABC transporter permease [Gluconobacter potus]|uniref:ABC transporter permease n=1 Tax=Gluconobacter potus TaxID=2724927 RepID=UPI0039E7641C
MSGYIIGRLSLAVPTLFLVSLAVFFLIRLVPGDPALVMLGEGADPATLAAMHRELGLDRPLVTQYLLWLGHALRGDLGISIVSGEPVGGLVLSHFALTVAVVLPAVAFATVLAVVFGMMAAWKHGQPIDLAVSATTGLLLAVPGFWLGLVLLIVFGVKLHWLPIVGYIPFSESAGAALLFLVLPIATLTLTETGTLTRMMRASAIDVFALDYITHARAKGLPERLVLARHVFPNAFAPTLTLIGLTLGHLLGGVAVVETVFTLPGLGRLMVDSILARDYPVIQGCLLLTALVFVLVNLVVDLIYPVFDPRVKS